MGINQIRKMSYTNSDQNDYNNNKNSGTITNQYTTNSDSITYESNHIFGLPDGTVEAIQNGKKSDDSFSDDHGIDGVFGRVKTELSRESIPYIELIPMTHKFTWDAGMNLYSVVPALQAGTYNYYDDSEHQVGSATVSVTESYIHYIQNLLNINLSPDMTSLKFCIDIGDSKVSESYSNQYGESSFEETLSEVQSKRIKDFAQIAGISGINDLNEGVRGLLGSFGANSASKGWDSINTALNNSPFLKNMISGSVGAIIGNKFDLPNTWSTCESNPTYQFTINLFDNGISGEAEYKKNIVGPLQILKTFVVPRSENGFSGSWPWMCKLIVPNQVERQCGYISEMQFSTFEPNNMKPNCQTVESFLGKEYRLNEIPKADSPNNLINIAQNTFNIITQKTQYIVNRPFLVKVDISYKPVFDMVLDRSVVKSNMIPNIVYDMDVLLNTKNQSHLNTQYHDYTRDTKAIISELFTAEVFENGWGAYYPYLALSVSEYNKINDIYPNIVNETVYINQGTEELITTGLSGVVYGKIKNNTTDTNELTAEEAENSSLTQELPLSNWGDLTKFNDKCINNKFYYKSLQLGQNAYTYIGDTEIKPYETQPYETQPYTISGTNKKLFNINTVINTNYINYLKNNIDDIDIFNGSYSISDDILNRLVEYYGSLYDGKYSDITNITIKNKLNHHYRIFIDNEKFNNMIRTSYDNLSLFTTTKTNNPKIIKYNPKELNLPSYTIPLYFKNEKFSCSIEDCINPGRLNLSKYSEDDIDIDLASTVLGIPKIIKNSTECLYATRMVEEIENNNSNNAHIRLSRIYYVSCVDDDDLWYGDIYVLNIRYIWSPLIYYNPQNDIRYNYIPNKTYSFNLQTEIKPFYHHIYPYPIQMYIKKGKLLDKGSYSQERINNLITKYDNNNKLEYISSSDPDFKVFENAYFGIDEIINTRMNASEANKYTTAQWNSDQEHILIDNIISFDGTDYFINGKKVGEIEETDATPENPGADNSE